MIVCIACIMILCGGYILYQKSIETAVSNTTVSFMEQLAEHDIKNVVSQSDNRVSYIHSLCKRIELVRREEQMDIPYLLSVEGQATPFEKIYLITTEGTVYDSTYLVSSLNEVAWADHYRSATGDFASRFETESRESWGEYLIYGSHLEAPVAYGNEWIEGVVGLVSLSDMDGLLSLESFGGRGTTILIQNNGDILTASRYYDSEERQNYFSELEHASYLNGGSFSKCKESIAQHESFYIQYLYQNVQYSAMLVPIDDIKGNDWYMVVKVLDEVTSDQTRDLMGRSLIFFVFLGVVVIIVAIFIFKTMKAEEAARASERAKTTFLANMSHEIRTPLNGITGLLYLMKQNPGDAEKQKEYIEKAEVSASFLKSVITDVLDMSKIESGQMDLYCQRLDLKKLLRDIRLLIAPQAQQRGQQFILNDEDLTSPWVMGDEVRLKQILVNLVGNSLKFTPAGGSISITVKQQTQADAVDTTFIISDTGCGMSPAFLEKIWKPFEQEKRLASQNGTGLGTTLSKALVDKMEGTITAESQQGQGTTFTIRIPFEITEAGNEAPQEGSAYEMVLAGKQILAAEDNMINREILTEILRAYGAVITPAINGQEAIDLFEQSKPYTFDFILMDIQMPIRNGYEAAQAIRAMERPDSKVIPILALTANAFKKDEEQALASGMDGFVTKPLNINTLLEKLYEIGSHGGKQEEEGKTGGL